MRVDIRDVGLIPESGRSPGGGHGNPFQYSCLKNPIETGSHRIRHDGRDLACTHSCFSKEKDKSFIVILLHWYIKGITLNSNVLQQFYAYSPTSYKLLSPSVWSKSLGRSLQGFGKRE